jgi:hypothetical protein
LRSSRHFVAAVELFEAVFTRPNGQHKSQAIDFIELYILCGLIPIDTKLN